MKDPDHWWPWLVQELQYNQSFWPLEAPKSLTYHFLWVSESILSGEVSLGHPVVYPRFQKEIFPPVSQEIHHIFKNNLEVIVYTPQNECWSIEYLEWIRICVRISAGTFVCGGWDRVWRPRRSPMTLCFNSKHCKTVTKLKGVTLNKALAISSSSHLLCSIKHTMWEDLLFAAISLLVFPPPPLSPLYVVPPPCLMDPSLGSHGYVTANGIKFHYVAKGSRTKPLMLLLHGFPEVSNSIGQK